MITRPTVLILGAGSSMPYQFPSGRKLMRDVYIYLSEKHPSSWIPILNQLGIETNHIQAFREELHYSGRASVDAFLEYRPEFLKVGKLAITLGLIPHEMESSLFNVTHNWYEYLFNKLNTPFEEFDENKLSIVTFNYDRSIEHYLFTVLRNAYGKSEKECANKLNKIQIIHVHGRLGALPWQEGPGRPYYHKVSLEEIKTASEQIVVISEDIETSTAFEKSFSLMSAADIICFLGFGYHEANLRRLKIDKLSNKTVLGAFYGLGDAEIRKICARWRILSPGSEFKIFDFLRNCLYLD